MVKRKIIIDSDSSESQTNYFKIEDYNIVDLPSLINLVEDLIEKPSPPKKYRRKLPIKLFKLIDILEPLKTLQSLIGLSKLKQQLLDQLLYFVQGDNDVVMLHTVIEGPPGTGKTTIANLMADIYSGIGILKKRKCTIVKREDLIGQYLGETTIKTMETLESAKNGVMLIDEAYSLGSPEGRDSYAKEAVDAINQYLTENVGKMICIIAGYKHELQQCFFSQNPGLRRRFPWTFTIEDFTPSELCEVFLKMVNDTDYYELAEDVSKEFIIKLIKKEYFTGNGGDIANIISRAKIINSRMNFCKENDYIFTKKIITESFEQFYDIRKNINYSEPPPMMYT